jgi:hypothetical protein
VEDAEFRENVEAEGSLGCRGLRGEAGRRQDEQTQE